MDKKVSRQFFNKEASNWDETASTNDVEKLRALAERLPIPKHASVLDVGTGTGVFVPYIRSKIEVSGQVVCLDFAYEMLVEAQKKNHDDRIHYVCAEIETVRFSDQKFNAVVCYSTFPHFHDKPLALGNIFDLLSPGGIVFICHTASREFINNIHKNHPPFADHLIPEKVEMTSLLEQSGFSEISITEDSAYYLAQATKFSN
jgi:ubiquinone/menaquinone biosynthesis C-methylase UbiE